MFAAALTICGTAAAEIVNISGSGVLSSAEGIYSAGDRFSFRTSYDDAILPTFTEDSLAFYNAAQAISFTVKRDTYLDDVLFFTVYDRANSTLNIGPPGDFIPQGIVNIAVGRSDSTDLSLPGLTELNGKPGIFSFFVVKGVDSSGNALFGRGGGPFTTIAAPIPEPEAWATMLAGMLMTALWLRRRQTRSWEWPPFKAFNLHACSRHRHDGARHSQVGSRAFPRRLTCLMRSDV
jgi:hypothetical protein